MADENEMTQDDVNETPPDAAAPKPVAEADAPAGEETPDGSEEPVAEAPVETPPETAPEPEETPAAEQAAALAPSEPAPASNGAPAPRLRQVYDSEIRPRLQEEFGYRSPMQHPRITKITLNMGVGEAKQNSKSLDEAVEQLAVIAGQRPVITRARKSIAQFKIRDGMAIGCKVTLRGARMWEFYDRLTSVALPRIRDFRGVNPDSFDGRGNFALGIREQTIFPEIDYDAIDQVRGLDVIITTSAATDEEGRALLRHLGMPFRADGYTAEERAARRRRKMRSRSRAKKR